MLPPPSSRKYWTRRGVAERLVEALSEGNKSTLVGVDHRFSFPLRYFEAHLIKTDCSTFLEDFCQHWLTDGDHIYFDFVRDGILGNGAALCGNSRWKRLTEERAHRVKSVFHFDLQGSVAKSTHAGIPWLRYIRKRLGSRVHFWPFDGWAIPEGKSVIAEVYPSMWSRAYKREDHTPEQHDAYSVAAWLSQSARDGTLRTYLNPDVGPEEMSIGLVEGWILGVTGKDGDDVCALMSTIGGPSIN